MKKLIKNIENLKEEEINEIVKIAKGIIINSKEEILLAYSHDRYQFIGGHVEENETLIETINREIKEETGMELNIKNKEPFACVINYYKNYQESGKNIKKEIYYYDIFTDIMPNLNNTKYTESEIQGNFELRYVKIKDIKEVLKNNIKTCCDKKEIVSQMIELFDIYLKECLLK